MNQNFYEPNLCYNSISSGFNQFQPPQFPVIHQPPHEMSEEMLQARENLMESIQTFLKKFNRISFRETAKELAEYINLPSWNCLAFYDDDDGDFSTPMSEIYKSSLTAITPDLPITDTLIMEDDHLDTIPEMESNELIKSSVDNLVPNPSKSEDLSDDLSKDLFEDLSDIEIDCDVPVYDDFTTFSNLLVDVDNDFSSGDDESFSDEEVPKEIYSNPFFDEENSIKIDPHHFNDEPYLIESLLKQDSLIISSPKIDSLLEEFSEFNSENSNIESFSPSPIPIEGSDSLMEEIDIFLAPDDSMPSSIENYDYDSEGDILFLEELLNEDS
nr:hypothetical protein [Tanacetum cinerariifolium]